MYKKAAHIKSFGNQHVHICVSVKKITIMHRRHDYHVAVVNLESHPLQNASNTTGMCW